MLVATAQFLLTPLREGRPNPICATDATMRYFYSRPCGRGDLVAPRFRRGTFVDFYSRPCGRGDHDWPATGDFELLFLLTPLREGRLVFVFVLSGPAIYFYSRPCGRGDCPSAMVKDMVLSNFYSRPCGRGDGARVHERTDTRNISTHAPAGGATSSLLTWKITQIIFLLTPLREGRRRRFATSRVSS